MKRHGALWLQVIDFANLMSAARQAHRGKRFRDNVLAFNFVLEDELLALRRELETKAYRPGPYKTFQIVEPKNSRVSCSRRGAGRASLAFVFFRTTSESSRKTCAERGGG